MRIATKIVGINVENILDIVDECGIIYIRKAVRIMIKKTEYIEHIEIEFDSETSEFHVNLYKNEIGFAKFITKEIIVDNSLKIDEQEGVQILYQHST